MKTQNWGISDRFRKRKSRDGKRINLDKDSHRLCGTEESFASDCSWYARGSKIGYQSAPSEEVRQSTLYQILHRMNGLSLRLEPAHEQVKFDVTEERRYSCPRKRLMGHYGCVLCVPTLSSTRKDRGFGDNHRASTRERKTLERSLSSISLCKTGNLACP